jgi:hypothetical protein
VVEVRAFSNGCTGNAASLCNPRTPDSISLDGTRVEWFATSGWLVWTDVPDGSHTLKILGGHYGGPVICGFWFDANDDQTLQLTVQHGSAPSVSVRFECF